MKIDAVKWGGELLIILGLMAGSAWAAWEWQANAYGQQLAAQEAAHQTERTDLAKANSAQILVEQAKRSPWSSGWQPATNPITEPLPMRKRNRHVCVIALLLLTCGCQSNSMPQQQLVVTQCKPPPAPAAWFMAPIEPDLTQRMLNELSESPAEAIKD